MPPEDITSDTGWIPLPDNIHIDSGGYIPVTSGTTVAVGDQQSAYVVDYQDDYHQFMMDGSVVATEHRPQYYLSTRDTNGGVHVIGSADSQQGIERLMQDHERRLRSLLAEDTEHINYTVAQAAESARGIHGTTALFDDFEALASLRNLQLEPSDDSLLPRSYSSVDSLIEYRFMEKQIVHRLEEYIPESGIMTLSPGERHALREYLNMTNPCQPTYYNGGGPCIYKFWNDKYTYVEQEFGRADGMGTTIKRRVYDRYGKYTIKEFLLLDRQEPEYKDMVNNIKKFYRKDEDSE